jgi:hypothetical protein
MAGSNSVSTNTPDPPLTVANVREMGQANLQKLQKVQLLGVVNTCMSHIALLELEKDKAPTDDSDELRTELRELKKAVFIVNLTTGANAHGGVPVGLTQGYWDTGDRSDIGWDAIHKLAAEQNGTPVASNGVVNAVANADATPATSVKEDNTSMSVKLAKRVKLAKSTALWCLLPFTPLTQEAKDKPRNVCPVNLGGRSAGPATAAANTPRSASWPTTARGKSPKPCACCGTCVSHSRETSPGGGVAPSIPPAARGTAAAMPGRTSPSRTSTSPSLRQSTAPRS